MNNFTETVNELEASTVLGQNVSEETTTELVNSSTKSMNDNVFYRIHMYGLIVLIPLGIIFNSISVIVFQKSQVFSTSIGNYLKCISISDTIILVGILLINTSKSWEQKLNFPNIISMNNASCVISTYIALVAHFSGTLILSSATIERFLAIAFPLKYRSWNTIRTSKIMLSVFFMYSLMAAAPTFFVLEISEKGECDIIQENMKTTELLYTIFVLIIANGICGGVILIFTIIIIVLLFHQSRKRNVLSNNDISSKSKRDIRISVMLVTIALFFMLFRYPKVIARKFTMANSGDPFLVQSLDKLTTVFVVVNHSVNFIIYMVFLESFRKSLCQMFSYFHVKIMECLYICRRNNPDEH